MHFHPSIKTYIASWGCGRHPLPVTRHEWNMYSIIVYLYTIHTHQQCFQRWLCHTLVFPRLRHFYENALCLSFSMVSSVNIFANYLQKNKDEHLGWFTQSFNQQMSACSRQTLASTINMGPCLCASKKERLGQSDGLHGRTSLEIGLHDLRCIAIQLCASALETK